MISTELAPGRVRRSYSKEFKRQVIAECHETGNSIAGVALRHGLNANVVHKWLRVHEAKVLSAPAPAFIELPSPRSVATSPTPPAIQIDVRRGDTTTTVYWPSFEAAACATWLNEWLR